MKRTKTELVFILDKSGSMSGLESDTIGGFNALLKKQQGEEGDATVTTVLFDDGYELLHERADIKSVAPITEKEYFVGGTTALLDAVGRTIQKIDAALRNEEQKSDKVLFVITTDGLENASREYTYDKVKNLIDKQKGEAGWEFLFLGANIDAVKTAARFGIGADRAADYHADGEGTRLNFSTVSSVVTSLRMGAAVPQSWKEDIDADFLRRKHKDTK